MNEQETNVRSSAASIFIRVSTIVIALVSIAYTFNRLVIHQNFNVVGQPTTREITE